MSDQEEELSNPSETDAPTDDIQRGTTSDDIDSGDEELAEQPDEGVTGD